MFSLVHRSMKTILENGGRDSFDQISESMLYFDRNIHSLLYYMVDYNGPRPSVNFGFYDALKLAVHGKRSQKSRETVAEEFNGFIRSAGLDNGSQVLTEALSMQNAVDIFIRNFQAEHP